MGTTRQKPTVDTKKMKEDSHFVATIPEVVFLLGLTNPGPRYAAIDLKIDFSILLINKGLPEAFAFIWHGPEVRLHCPSSGLTPLSSLQGY